jgi:cellulose synthase/poly-beta-1,6-N-acetylglucosamine synthase-like glycosyltransferase
MVSVNVIIAQKDYTHFLPDAIESCLKQTIPVKYTIIDDGSFNKPIIPTSFKKAGNGLYIDDNDNKMVFLTENYGPSTARNVGIGLNIQNYDYFMILDADDMMLPNKTEVLLREFEDKKVGVAYGDYFIKSDRNTKMEFKKPFDRLLLERECIVHSGSLIKKEALIAVAEDGNFYDPNLRVAEDYDLWLRISEKMLIRHVPEFLSIVRSHNQDSSNSVKQEIWNQCLQIVHQKRLQRNQ